MYSNRSNPAPGPFLWRLSTFLLLAVFGVAGCAPADEAGEDGMADDMAMEEDAGMEMEAEGSMAEAAPDAMAQDMPNCVFTASGEELTGRASPPDSAMAQVGEGMVKLCYGAPSMNEREIMGGLVPFGEPWRIGANEPTTLHLPVVASIGGVEVAPGAYSLYAIPGESEWEIVINSNTDRWGIPIDDSVRQSDVGSFTVPTESTDTPVEQLSIELDPADGGADAVIEWETTRITFPIRPTAP